MRFYVGLHHPTESMWLDRAFVSVNAADHRPDFYPNEWVLDSGAFTQVALRGGYEQPPSAYAASIRRHAKRGKLQAAVAQDFMCEPFVLAKTGGTIADHQRWTIERYRELAGCDTGGTYVMPVLQGFAADDYRRHVEAYGDLLEPGAWVGVGSVCKRNGSPAKVAAVLRAIHDLRPDLRLHGFGVKLTSLSAGAVVRHLFSADSCAWSFAARKAADEKRLVLEREFGRRLTRDDANFILGGRGEHWLQDQNDPWMARHYELRVLKGLAAFDADEMGERAHEFGTALVRMRFRAWMRWAEAAFASLSRDEQVAMLAGPVEESA